MPKKEVDADVGVGAKVRLRKFIGACNRCGLCCARGMLDWRMTHDDPDNWHGQQFKRKCVYLKGNPGVGKTTSCKIMTAEVDIDTIPTFHREYYLRECPDYPSPLDPTEWSGDGPVGVVDVCAFRKFTIVRPD